MFAYELDNSMCVCCDYVKVVPPLTQVNMVILHMTLMVLCQNYKIVVDPHYS